MRLERNQGITRGRDSAELSWENLRVAENCLDRGGLIVTPPLPARLWGMPNIRHSISSLGLVADDEVVLLRVKNEGHQFLAYYDVPKEQVLGMVYAGRDPQANVPSGGATWGGEEGVPSWEVVQRNFSSAKRWDSLSVGSGVVMGNGEDPNVVYEAQNETFRGLGASVRPLAPGVAMVSGSDARPIDASLTVGGITFVALEPDYRPTADSQTMRRGDGNFVKVAIFRGGYETFESTLSGVGTLDDPYVYTLWTPRDAPDESEVVRHILRDPNAAGVVTAISTGQGGYEFAWLDPAMQETVTGELSQTENYTDFSFASAFSAGQVPKLISAYVTPPLSSDPGIGFSHTGTITESGGRVYWDAAAPQAGYVYTIICAYLES